MKKERYFNMVGVSLALIVVKAYSLIMILSSICLPLMGELDKNFGVKNATERFVSNNLHLTSGKTTAMTTTIVTTEMEPVFPLRLKEPKLPEGHVFLFDRYMPPQVEGIAYCRLPAKCQDLNYSTCLGSKIPYLKTTLELVDGLRSQEQAQEQLQVWRGLVNLPKCWAVIQPFLCALYMPKCDNDMVDLPSHEMCKMIMGPCRILAIDHGWPSVLKCDNFTKYPLGCKNDVRDMKFNTTGKCKPPMVQTDYPSSFYDGMEGCGVQCDNPLFTPDERYQIHRFVAWTATISFIFNLFTVVTFMIDWRSSRKYPALVIFYINFCFMIVCVGWLAQFLPGGRDDIVCRKDGTLRIGEPSAGENLSCVVVFVLVYYFLMAGIVWFVILMYALNVSFQAFILGKIQERLQKKGAYFHLVAWSLPLVLTITTMAFGEIDGNSVVGICFVGYINHIYRISLLLVPVFIALSVGGYFLLKGLLTLIRLKINSQEIVSERASAKIRETIVRMGFFSLLIFVIAVTSFVCHIYEFRHSSSWKESFRRYIVCRLGVSEYECRLETRPSLAILQLHILALFATGVIMSSWVWTSSTVDTWKRFFKRFSNEEIEEHVKVKKHKLIARAFSKRKMLNSNGRLSISIHNTYQDPVGLDFELNSFASGEIFSSFSSTWAAALPKLVTRRGALTGVTNSNSSQRRNSVDSEISYSVRRVSVESRRHSLDSAVSVQVEERTRTLHSGSHRSRRKRQHRDGRRTRHRVALPASSRHGSTTSQESQLGAQILSALNAIGSAEQPPVPSLFPNLNRRPGNAGLDGSLTILTTKLFGNLTTPLNYTVPDHTPESSGEEQVEEKQDSSAIPLEEKPLNSSSQDEDDSEGGGHLW
ncbi:smoothened, frizzled class receptor [Lycorma delicatula]|uniref:smoothened, frizzled class receptor n=1 Tax=Lycorma delicatula TaxID=130591 RepID=UPI003F51500E